MLWSCIFCNLWYTDVQMTRPFLHVCMYRYNVITACTSVQHVIQHVNMYYMYNREYNMYCRMYVVDVLHMYMYICNTRLCYHSQTTQPSQSSCGYHNSGSTEPISHSLLGLMTVVYINCFVSPISSPQITYSPLNSNFVSE